MSVTEIYELDGVTVGSTAYSIPSGSTTPAAITTDGVWQLWVDPVQGGALTKGDHFEAVIMEKVLSGSTQRRACSMQFGGVDQVENFVMPPMLLMHGWDMLIDKIAGTDRAMDASIRGTACTITQAYSMSAVSVSTSEISIVSGTTTLQTIAAAGVYQLWIDFTNMVKGDQYEIRVYEKAEATGGTKRQFFETTVHDVQTQLFATPMFTLMHGWDMTVKLISGSARTLDASIRKVG